MDLSLSRPLAKTILPLLPFLVRSTELSPDGRVAALKATELPAPLLGEA